jgi:hypothetical protein
VYQRKSKHDASHIVKRENQDLLGLLVQLTDADNIDRGGKNDDDFWRGRPNTNE